MPIPRRQSRRLGAYKLFRCNYIGCDKVFYYSKSMLRHQTLKHGRKPSRGPVLRLQFSKQPDALENELER